MSKISTEQMMWWLGFEATKDNGDRTAQIIQAIRAALLERDAIKKELDEVATKASYFQHDLLCEERDRKKAEAELAAARPLLEAVKNAETFTTENDLVRFSLFPQMSAIIEAALAYRVAKEKK